MPLRKVDSTETNPESAGAGARAARAGRERAGARETTDASDRGPRHPSTHSHSMVPGGFDVTSSTTRFTPLTSLVMRFEMRASTS